MLAVPSLAATLSLATMKHFLMNDKTNTSKKNLHVQLLLVHMLVLLRAVHFGIEKSFNHGDVWCGDNHRDVTTPG